MKEFIDKLIERLEQEIQDVSESQRTYEAGSNMSITCSHIMGVLRDVKNRIIPKLAEEYKGKSNNTFETIYDKVCSLEKKYANDGNVESVNDCIKLENLLQYFKEELQSAEEYKLFGKTEQVKGGWIPVSERLPKEDERILCLHSDGFIDCGVLIGETWCCDMDEYAVIRDDIHAWMPLPAPYTEGE